ncbi:hypothetical protein 2 [Changjiang crawfish virus 7]|uniref:hypothetical protein 2 n=1 Tax=Changjiang crawfish virus 7 TaxID=1922771 RepID=UPI000909E029|nr:hypothetical protein 2 [Changjiang crawfish virus 7]APG76238.1 hypothetical protein 2 [Changjiang crawfish virus 7]
MPEVSVDQQGYSQKLPKRLFDIRGLPGRGTLWTHANDVANVVQSVHERVLGRTTSKGWERTLLPEEGAFDSEGMVRFSTRLKQKLGSHSLPVTEQDFLSHYRGQKRRRYEAAVSSLRAKPVQRADSYPSVFLKAEKWREEKPGRLISARSPRYNVEVGRYLLPLEPLVYQAIDGVWGSATIMKGYTPERRAAVVRGHWDSFGDPVAVGHDFSKFDQHISKRALQYEHGVYLRAYAGDEHLQKLLSWQLETTCYANVRDGRVKYTVKGGRMSGDMNTAMGNCIISAGLIWAYAAESGVQLRAVVDGDDSVVFMEKKDLQRYLAGIEGWMAKRGFRLVTEEPVYEINRVEFCQCRYMDTVPPTMVRNPLKAITQDHAWIEDRSISYAEVLAATGLGGLSLYGHIPVLGAYYDLLARTTQPSRRTLNRLDFRSSWLRDATMSGGFTEPSEQARYQFWLTWGMSPGEQRAHEMNFRACDLQDLVASDTITKATRNEKTDPYGNNYYL